MLKKASEKWDEVKLNGFRLQMGELKLLNIHVKSF